MKKIKLILKITALALVFMACGNNCGKTTYRPEIGIGYVFKETDSGLVPVAGATVTVYSVYREFGLFGKDWIVAEESFITDVEGRYQARFVEKGCYTKHDGRKEMVHCNFYRFYCGNNWYYGILQLDNAIDNMFLLDTIKLK